MNKDLYVAVMIDADVFYQYLLVMIEEVQKNAKKALTERAEACPDMKLTEEGFKNYVNVRAKEKPRFIGDNLKELDTHYSRVFWLSYPKVCVVNGLTAYHWWKFECVYYGVLVSSSNRNSGVNNMVGADAEVFATRLNEAVTLVQVGTRGRKDLGIIDAKPRLLEL